MFQKCKLENKFLERRKNTCKYATSTFFFPVKPTSSDNSNEVPLQLISQLRFAFFISPNSPSNNGPETV